MPAESSINMSLLSRLQQEWRAKAALYGFLCAIFSIPYFLLQRFPIFTPRYFTLTPLDRAIGFQPGWLWIYQSTYLLIPIAPLLSITRKQLALYARGYLCMTAVGVAFFVFFPVEAPRPADIPHDGLWALLLSYDKTLNTFPSLHVAMVAQSLAFAFSLIHPRWTPKAIAAFAIGLLWALLIAYSTLATKQHYAVDVPAGIALGLVSHLVATWRTPVATPLPDLAAGLPP